MGYLSDSYILDSTYVTQPYHINGEGGYNYDHWGIDLVCWNGSYTTLGWILAHSDGEVVGIRNDCAGFESGSYGNFVLIKHPNNMYTLYAHGAYGTVCVSVGQKVKRRQRIMFMGNTGESYGGHVHFEIRQPNGYRINPEPYLKKDLPGNDDKKIKITGKFDKQTVEKLQRVLSLDYKYVTVTGVVENQYADVMRSFTTLTTDAWEMNNNGKGSTTIKAIQTVLRSWGLYDGNIDGLAGPLTAGGLQLFLRQWGYNLDYDKIFGPESTKAYQDFLNKFEV